MVTMGSQRGGVEGSRMALLRCLGRFRGTKGVLLGSYVQCLGRFRGQTGVPEGVPFRCLGRIRGVRCLRLGVPPSVFRTF